MDEPSNWNEGTRNWLARSTASPEYEYNIQCMEYEYGVLRIKVLLRGQGCH